MRLCVKIMLCLGILVTKLYSDNINTFFPQMLKLGRVSRFLEVDCRLIDWQMKVANDFKN